MSHISLLTEQVAKARLQFISSASGLTDEQANFKPDADTWSINENVEHMFWAELGGINGMWKAIAGVRSGNPIFTGANPNAGLTIEEIIARTWKEKEQVPEIAKPRWGGPIGYWISALEACQPMLEALAKELETVDAEQVIHPHIISGPLNAIQRFEFLRFHLQRHLAQIERTKQHPQFPKEGLKIATAAMG